VTEAVAGARLLGEDRADHRDRDRDLGAREQGGERGRALDVAERLGAGGVERAHELAQVGIHRGEAVERRHDDGEEADQADDGELRGEVVAEPRHEQRRHDHDRNGLRGHEQGIGGAAQGAREVDGHRQRDACGQRHGDAEQHLAGRDGEVVPQQPAVVP